MRLRKQLFLTLLIQGMGAGAMFITVIAVGYSGGPAVQGVFSKLKSEVEFISSLTLLGMPSAVLYFTLLKKLSVKRSISIAIVASILAALLAFFYCMGTDKSSAMFAIVFPLACAAFVAHSIIRVLVLPQRGNIAFGFVTAAPQFILLGLALFVIERQQYQEFGFASTYLIAFLLAFFLALILLRGPGGLVGKSDVGTFVILKYGGATAVGNILSAASNLLWITYVQSSLGLAAVGVFTLGLTLVQVAIAPISYTAPLLLGHLMKTPQQNMIKPAIVAGLVVFLIAAVLAQFNAFYSDWIGLVGYSGLHTLRWSLAATVMFEVIFRVPLSAVYASGKPWLYAIAESLRLASLCVSIFLPFTTLEQFAWLWAAATATAAATIILSLYTRPS